MDVPFKFLHWICPTFIWTLFHMLFNLFLFGFNFFSIGFNSFVCFISFYWFFYRFLFFCSIGFISFVWLVYILFCYCLLFYTFNSIAFYFFQFCFQSCIRFLPMFFITDNFWKKNIFVWFWKTYLLLWKLPTGHWHARCPNELQHHPKTRYDFSRPEKDKIIVYFMEKYTE